MFLRLFPGHSLISRVSRYPLRGIGPPFEKQRSLFYKPVQVDIKRPLFYGFFAAKRSFGRIACDNGQPALLKRPVSKAQAGPICKLDKSHAQFEEQSSPLTEFWALIKPDILLLLAVSVTAIATAFVNLTTPRIIGRLVNVLSSVLQSGAIENWTSIVMKIRSPSLYLFSLFLAQGYLTFLYISLVSLFGERVSMRLKQKLFSNLLIQDIGFFDSVKVGDLVSRLSSDVAEFKHSLKQSVSQGLKSITQVFGAAVQLFSISFYLTTVLLISAPILYGFGSFYGSYLRLLSKDAKNKEAQTSAIASEAFSNIKTVRAFASEDFEIACFNDSLRDSSRAQQKLGFHIGMFQGFTNFSIGSMILFVLYQGGSMVARGDLTGGDLMSYLISIQNAQKSLASMSVLFSQIIKAQSSFAQVVNYLSLQPQISPMGGVRPSQLEGNIRFSNVSFAYPTRPADKVLDRFNLDIEAGSVVALCGLSGSGKSTIGVLIERFYDVHEGSVSIDGTDIKHLNTRWLRENVGYIHQEPILFAGSIYENIKYGSPNATRENVIEAARQANALEFIEGFENKFETTVGERGVTLSGGQKQRIAIARALLKNPKIMIFDEATSALDANSEKVVQEALDRLMKGRTVLIIAHRLSTIQNADKIIVLSKGGKILESGTHCELLKARGQYSRLYDSKE